MGFLISFLLTRTGRMVAGAGGILLMIWMFGAYKESEGKRKERANNAAETDKRISKADTAGSKSRAGGGMLNPHYRD